MKKSGGVRTHPLWLCLRSKCHSSVYIFQVVVPSTLVTTLRFYHIHSVFEHDDLMFEKNRFKVWNYYYWVNASISIMSKLFAQTLTLGYKY